MSGARWFRRTKRPRAAPLDADPLAEEIRRACRDAAAAGEISVKPGIHLDPDRELDGYCSVMAESYFNLGGRRAAGLKLMQLSHRGNSHWWVSGPDDRIIDLIAEPGERIVPYERGRAQGFRNGRLSARAKTILERVIQANGR